MTNKIIQKNIKLSLEFDKYLNSHPKLYSKIPNGAHVFITVKGDKELNKANIKSASSRGILVEARKEDGSWTVRSAR